MIGNAATHFYCENCKKITPATYQGAVMPDVSLTFIGGDIVCDLCSWVIATAYILQEKDK